MNTTIYRHLSSSFQLKDGVWVMRLRAESYYDAGRHHGALLRAAKHPTYRIFRNLAFALCLDTVYLLYRKSFDALLIDEVYRDEIRGISDTTGIPMRRLIVANFFFDVFKRGVFCSTFNFFAPDALIARNTDTFVWLARLSLRYQATVVFRISVRDRLTFSHVGFALCVGVLNGYNARGIALNNHMVSNIRKIRTQRRRPVPPVLQFRKIMEEAGNLEEAKIHLSCSFFSYPALTLLTDCENKISAIFESVPGSHDFAGMTQPYQACTMHFETESMSDFSRDAFATSRMRMTSIRKALKGKACLGADAASEILKDTCNGLIRKRGGRSVTNNGTFQSFICLPMKDVLLISNGRKLPVSLNGKYIRIDFKRDI